MAKYSILIPLDSPDWAHFEQTIASVRAQTFVDWQVVLLGSAADLTRAGILVPEAVKLLLKEDEPPTWGVNRNLAQLGTWLGFLGQHDRLLPTALAELDAALQQAPAARVAYTDEECRNAFGLLSMRSRKGMFDPLRLQTQEYLRDFAVIERATLTVHGGFSQLANNSPTQEYYLRLFRAQGSGVFLYLPQRLYQRFRDHRHSLPRVDHDLWAVQDHLAQQGLPATVRYLNGRLDIEYRPGTWPQVTVLIVVGDDWDAGLQRLHRSQLTPVYPAAQFRVVHLGTDPEAEQRYRGYCSGLRLRYVRSELPLVPALNQETQTVDTDFVLFLQGNPVNTRWLHRLMAHAALPNPGAVGARCWSGTRLHFPGVLNHAYEGWDWNTAGRFDVLTVPHQAMALPSACLLVDTRRFLAMSGFNPVYPTLYAMDLCLRLDQAGFPNMWIPEAQVEVEKIVTPVTESDDFHVAWTGWVDRFGLHQ